MSESTANTASSPTKSAPLRLPSGDPPPFLTDNEDESPPPSPSEAPPPPRPPRPTPMEHDAFYRPPQLGTLTTLKLFFYNRETGQVFGRTMSSWAKIGLFYLIFYGVLAGMFAAMLMVFFQTLDPRIPKWQLDSSIIGTNPGLGFRPMPSEANVDSSLIWYKGTEKENWQHWTDKLDEFLNVYRTPGLTPGRGQNIFNCDYNHLPGPGQVCDEDVKNWKPCTSENYYDYHKSTPCIFLKLNKIYGWVPEYYNDTENLPKEMPEDLKEYIHDLKKTNPKKLNTVWVSCEGENPADVENAGQIEYLPADRRGFPGYFYPFENSEGYLSPLVAIHFERPTSGVLLNIECKAWAKNIIHDRTDRIGSVHFELMID
ncbi:sodium/potassium-transporting ATPase subunit beta-2-like isoform X1 [Hetaerina americana]|uniref:sodium/potassium-transporting ATPase subunit beta-2-like isoform X1 n=1 Tax=Hetaerina americana TaxID=62018 RepID=UPI003A7F6001